MRTPLVGLLAASFLAGCDLNLSDLDDSCEYERNFYDETSAAGIATLRLFAETGNLRIEGRSGLQDVRVRARACASDLYAADDIDFDFFRSNGELTLETYVPDRH